MGTRSDDTSPKKSYVWLHPPKKIELNIHDQLFVLCEKREKENQFDKNKGKIDAGAGNQSNIEQTMKADGTRVQNELMKRFDSLNQGLKELLFSSKELDENVKKSGNLLEQDLGYKIRSALEHL